MTPGLLKEWLGVIALAISVGGFFYAWLTSRSKTNSEQLDKLDSRVDELVTKVQAVEHELKHMPDRETIADLRIVVEGLKAGMLNLQQTSTATQNAIRRVEDFLIRAPK